MIKALSIAAIAGIVALFGAFSTVPSHPVAAVPEIPYEFAVTPASATNMVGTEHCVTATLTDPLNGDEPVAGVSITFSVNSASAMPPGDTDTTDANGEATFCYTSIEVGNHTITALADVVFNPCDILCGPGLRASAQKAWNLGACTGMVFDKTIIGTTGNDTITATGLRELILGIQGNDVINGGAGNDCIVGGAGNDTLGGGSGNDKLFGDVGNDIVNGDSGTDVGNGGTGTDTCNAESETACEI